MTREKTRDELDKYDDNLSKLFDFIRSQFHIQSFVFVGTHCDSCEQTRVFISSDNDITDPASYLNDAVEVLEHEITVLESERVDAEDDDADDDEYDVAPLTADEPDDSSDRSVSQVYVSLGGTVHYIPVDDQTDSNINGTHLRDWERIYNRVSTPNQLFIVSTQAIPNVFARYSPFITIVLAVYGAEVFKVLFMAVADDRKTALANHLKEASRWVRTTTVFQ